jgi:uncharacterized OB-fold protein
MTPSSRDDLAAAWWRSLADGRLTVQTCAGCGTRQHPPRAACARCRRAGDLGWSACDGRGVVVSATRVHTTTYPAFTGRLPFWVVLVRLGPDAHLLANLLDDTESVPTGAAARVVVTGDHRPAVVLEEPS